MSFHDYMRAYSEDHQHPVNKLTHMIGIPLIVGSLPVIPIAPPVGLTMFGVGWGLSGYCPGPALTGLLAGNAEAGIVVAAMLAGAWLQRQTNRG